MIFKPQRSSSDFYFDGETLIKETSNFWLQQFVFFEEIPYEK